MKIIGLVTIASIFLWNPLKAEVLISDTDAGIEKNKLGFYSYRPNYFGFTTSSSEDGLTFQAKFQFSAKYKIIEERDFYFGYTQKSFWNLQKNSVPFAESNFSPEIFSINSIGAESCIKLIQVGWYQHESTGEAGRGSFGWNRSYIEPTCVLGNLSITPKIWFPLFFKSKRSVAPDNPDIFNYMGYGELRFAYETSRGNNHSLILTKGAKADKISSFYQWDIDLDNIWDFFGIGNKYSWNLTLFIQLWSGYGESLKNYKTDTDRVLIGISAIR